MTANWRTSPTPLGFIIPDMVCEPSFANLDRVPPSAVGRFDSPTNHTLFLRFDHTSCDASGPGPEVGPVTRCQMFEVAIHSELRQCNPQGFKSQDTRLFFNVTVSSRQGARTQFESHHTVCSSRCGFSQHRVVKSVCDLNEKDYFLLTDFITQIKCYFDHPFPDFVVGTIPGTSRDIGPWVDFVYQSIGPPIIVPPELW